MTSKKNLETKFFRIGEIESRKNVFLVEREAKNTLFKAGSSPTPSRTASVDKFILNNGNVNVNNVKNLVTDLIINKEKIL